jgi:hypothetical protein
MEKKTFRRFCQVLQFSRRDGFQGIPKRPGTPGFDFDKGKNVASPSDQVDFSERCPVARVQDLIAFASQMPFGDPFPLSAKKLIPRRRVHLLTILMTVSRPPITTRAI